MHIYGAHKNQDECNAKCLRNLFYAIFGHFQTQPLKTFVHALYV